MPDGVPRHFGCWIEAATIRVDDTGEVLRVVQSEMPECEATVRTIRGPWGQPPRRSDERFADEARLLTTLRDPAIERVTDYGFTAQDEAYVLSQRIEGASLAALLTRGALAPSDARELGVQVARALSVAHAAGIRHRDLGPSRLLRGDDGQWMLVDWSLVHPPTPGPYARVPWTLGANLYRDPDALFGVFTDRSDVFSTAAILVEAATGVSFSPAARASLASLAPGLAAILEPVLASPPAARPTAAQLGAQLAASP